MNISFIDILLKLYIVAKHPPYYIIWVYIWQCIISRNARCLIFVSARTDTKQQNITLDNKMWVVQEWSPTVAVFWVKWPTFSFISRLPPSSDRPLCLSVILFTCSAVPHTSQTHWLSRTRAHAQPHAETQLQMLFTNSPPAACRASFLLHWRTRKKETSGFLTLDFLWWSFVTWSSPKCLFLGFFLALWSFIVVTDGWMKWFREHHMHGAAWLDLKRIII